MTVIVVWDRVIVVRDRAINVRDRVAILLYAVVNVNDGVIGSKYAYVIVNRRLVSSVTGATLARLSVRLFKMGVGKSRGHFLNSMMQSIQVKSPES